MPIQLLALFYTYVFHLTVLRLLCSEKVLEAIVVVLSRCGHPSICCRLVRTFECFLNIDLNVAFFSDELSDDIFCIKVLCLLEGCLDLIFSPSNSNQDGENY